MKQLTDKRYAQIMDEAERVMVTKDIDFMMEFLASVHPKEIEAAIERRKAEAEILEENNMSRFDPKTQIAVIWDIEDVKSVRSDLDDEQAMKVLLRMKASHDANVGINWEVIETTAEILFPE